MATTLHMSSTGSQPAGSLLATGSQASGGLLAAAGDLMRALGAESLCAAISRRRLLVRLRSSAAVDAARRGAASIADAAPPAELALAVAIAADSHARGGFASDDDELAARLAVVNEVLRAARGMMFAPAPGSMALVYSLTVARWDINFISDGLPSYSSDYSGLSDYSCDSE